MAGNGPGGVAPNELDHREQVYAIRTWRYLRLAMIVLVVGLGVSIGYERAKTHPGCFQRSISAYYYTPVHAVFVGALIAIGTCLVCLRGNTEIEDLLLNVSGMLAPVVALVPIADTGSCASVLGTAHDRNVNIANNVFALLGVGLVGVLILAVLLTRRLLAHLGRPSVTSLVGNGVGVALWVLTLVMFAAFRAVFTHIAHYAAAVTLFACILVVVIINAVEFKTKTGAQTLRNRYTVIAAAMVLATIGIGIAGLAGWTYWVLAIETALITLFAVFWTTQTQELWHDGLR